MDAGSRNLHSDRTMSATEAAYFAGFMDGEGTITIVRSKTPERRTGWKFNALVSVANCDRDVLMWLRTTCGNGWIHTTKKTLQKAHHRMGYSLRFTPHQMRHLLPQIVLYLHCKKVQAQLLLEFLNLTRRISGAPASDAYWQTQEDYRVRLSNLNQRGLGPGKVPDVLTVAPARHENQWTTGQQVKKPCRVEGCSKRNYAKGYCRNHHYQYVIGLAVYERNCVVCSKLFTAKRSDTECCSKRCSDRYQYVKNQETRNAYTRKWRAKQKRERA